MSLRCLYIYEYIHTYIYIYMCVCVYVCVCVFVICYHYRCYDHYELCGLCLTGCQAEVKLAQIDSKPLLHGIGPEWRKALALQFEKPYFAQLQRFLQNAHNNNNIIYPAGKSSVPFSSLLLVVFFSSSYCNLCLLFLFYIPQSSAPRIAMPPLSPPPHSLYSLLMQTLRWTLVLSMEHLRNEV